MRKAFLVLVLLTVPMWTPAHGAGKAPFDDPPERTLAVPQPRIGPGTADDSLDQFLLEFSGFPKYEFSWSLYEEVSQIYKAEAAADPRRSWEKLARTRDGYLFKIKRSSKTRVVLDATPYPGFLHEKVIFVDDTNNGRLNRLILKGSRDEFCDLTRYSLVFKREGEELMIIGTSRMGSFEITYDALGHVSSFSSKRDDPTLGVYRRTNATRKLAGAKGDGGGYYTLVKEMKSDLTRWGSTYTFRLPFTGMPYLHSSEFYFHDPRLCEEAFACNKGITRKIRMDYLYGDSNSFTVTMYFQDNAKNASHIIEGISPDLENDAANERLSFSHLSQTISQRAGTEVWGDLVDLIRVYGARHVLVPASLCTARGVCLTTAR